MGKKNKFVVVVDSIFSFGSSNQESPIIASKHKICYECKRPQLKGAKITFATGEVEWFCKVFVFG